MVRNLGGAVIRRIQDRDATPRRRHEIQVTIAHTPLLYDPAPDQLIDDRSGHSMRTAAIQYGVGARIVGIVFELSVDRPAKIKLHILTRYGELDVWLLLEQGVYHQYLQSNLLSRRCNRTIVPIPRRPGRSALRPRGHGTRLAGLFRRIR